jgi:hypothetical protein
MIAAWVFFAIFAAVVVAQDDLASARVLLHKSTTTDPVVSGRDFVINYQLINTGDAPATSITISDRYDAQSFETIENINVNGSVSFSLKELVPGGQVRMSFRLLDIL